ncbi:hypothetical protein L1987_05151 [Smallanthus sonchifolius]|uniref:Uncharacterized protein n=1 Tax=Smallanthus sonchifolius TaxID=185202 RepID=A0ACB9JUI9_9ASTR|nr:hypothetical protein L1987_05151 [Smallanthus sonchifolius]
MVLSLRDVRGDSEEVFDPYEVYGNDGNEHVQGTVQVEDDMEQGNVQNHVVSEGNEDVQDEDDMEQGNVQDESLIAEGNEANDDVEYVLVMKQGNEVLGLNDFMVQGNEGNEHV